MASISLCMIVKNEERVLARCLDSLKGLMDEIIIVDTGSKDATKEIAFSYTDRVYDFEWTDDFAAARNFAFSKAGCDYIYSADADEVLDEENREKFRLLKESLEPEVEIVQMVYANQLSFGTIYNYDRELRPKLFKRIVSFQWTEPIHETVRTFPIVFDSDIAIMHMPEKSHAQRDFEAFRRHLAKDGGLSDRLFNLYAKELFVSGKEQDFLEAEEAFTKRAEEESLPADKLKEALCVIVKAAFLRKDYLKMYRYALKDIAGEGVSEVCCVLGDYYFAGEEYEEAALWYYNAAYETGSVLSIRCSGDIPLTGLIRCYERLGNTCQAEVYREQAALWRQENPGMEERLPE